MQTREEDLQELEAAVIELKDFGFDMSAAANATVLQAAEDLLYMNRKYTRFEFYLVVVHRYWNDREYRRDRYKKKDLAHAEKGLADWNENKARILRTTDFQIKWTAHIETREIIEFPWETVGEEEE